MVVRNLKRSMINLAAVTVTSLRSTLGARNELEKLRQLLGEQTSKKIKMIK